LQNWHVILIDFRVDLPILTLAFAPGGMNDLHFLQNCILTSYGNLTRYFVLILFARIACFCASSGSDRMFDWASFSMIWILSSAICFGLGFTGF
jgi:hypothetical protein